MADTSSIASRQVLAQTPARVLVFLRAVGTSIPIRAFLDAAGYTVADHQEGWRLLHKVSGYGADVVAPPEDTSIRDAMLELDNNDEKIFTRIRAGLHRLHKPQEEFIFRDGLEPSKGAGSVLAMSHLLSRLEELKSSPERKATRKEDHAALKTLASRRFDANELARLQKLVDTAQGAAPLDPSAKPNDEDDGLADLIALREWYLDWSETARSVIKRRDYLIALGLAQRIKKKKPEPEPKPQ